MVTADVFATVLTVACNFMVRESYWEMVRELCQQNERVKELTQQLNESETKIKNLKGINNDLKLMLHHHNYSESNKLNDDNSYELETGGSGAVSEEDFYFQEGDFNSKNNSIQYEWSSITPTILNDSEECELSLRETTVKFSDMLNRTKENLNDCLDNLKQVNKINLYRTTTTATLSESVTSTQSLQETTSKTLCEDQITKISELEEQINDQEQNFHQNSTTSDEAIKQLEEEINFLKTTNETLSSELSNLRITLVELENNKRYQEIKNEILTKKVNILETDVKNLTEKVKSLKTAFQCPWGSKQVKSNPTVCFSFHQKETFWGNAKSICEYMGGTLAQNIGITDQDLFNNIIKNWPSIAGAMKGGVWIGGTDSEREGVWKWLNGNAVSIPKNKWYRNQRKNVSSKDCLLLKLDENRRVRFFHGKCSSGSEPFLCQFESSSGFPE